MLFLVVALKGRIHKLFFLQKYGQADLHFGAVGTCKTPERYFSQ